MAEIRDDLVLDISQALAEVDQLERALDRALTGTELRIDPTSAREFEDALQKVERSVDLINTDLAAIETSSGVSEVNFREIAIALGISEDRASELAGEILESQAAANRVEAAARDVARQLDLSEDEARRFTSALARADIEAKEVADSTTRISGGFATLRSNALGLVAGFGAFAAIRSAVRFAGEARDAFATLQDSANAVNVVFGEAATTINEFGQSVAQTAGLSTAEFNQAASVLGSALLNVGFGAEEAADKTVILTQRAADMASVFGGEVSVALGAIQAALRGEIDPIERFGVGLTAAAVEARAAALGFEIVDGELSNTAKAAARLDLILEQTARTSGDFANTSGDLANATKIAAAEFENMKAEVGEALLPVFQSLLDAAPEILQALIDLTPALQDLALGVADLLTSKEGMLDFVDILRTLSDLPRGFGQIGDGIRLLVEGAGTAGGVLERLLNRDFAGAIEAAKDGLAGLGDEAQRSLERVNTQGLIDDLRQGEDAALALANRLAEVGRKGKLDPAFIRDLSKIAGTDLRQTALALQTVVNGAAQLGLTADEVMDLNVALAQLASLGESSEADRIAARNRDIAETATPATTAMSELAFAAETAGLSVAEFALSADPAVQALLDSLDPADRLALFLAGIQTNAGLAAEAFRTTLTPAVGDVTQALSDLNRDGSADLDEFIDNLIEGGLAALTFVDNISKIAESQPGLAAALAAQPIEIAGPIAQQIVDEQRAAETELARTQPEELAETLRQIITEGIGLVQTDPAAVEGWVGAVLAGFEGAVPEVKDRVLTELSTALSEVRPTLAELLDVPEIDVTEAGVQVRETLIDGVTSRRRLAQEAAAVTASLNAVLDVSQGDLDPIDLNESIQTGAEQIRVPELTDRFNDILNSVTDGLGLPDLTPVVEDAVDDIDIGRLTSSFTSIFDTALTGLGLDIDLFDVGAEARQTLIDGLATPQPGEVGNVQNSILTVLDTAIERDSPPKLFLRAGEESRDAFWSAFDNATAVEMPEIRIPDIVIPDIIIPDVVLPEIEIPPVAIPDVELPEILVPAPQIEPVTLPDVLLPDITIPAIDIGPVDLTASGLDAGASLIIGVSSGITSEIDRLHVAIENATNAALEARSPSQLMLRLGESAGQDFWAGFNQAELTLKTPISPFTGSVTGFANTATANVTDGGFTFAPTYVNTETKDLETVVARSEQTMAAVSGLLGKIKLA